MTRRGYGLGVRGRQHAIPLSEQGLAAAEFDAAEEAADAAFAAANPVCICPLDHKGGIWECTPDCPVHGGEQS